ncbi:MAG: cytidine deaminase [Verrucomicrobiota bacterium]|nr:cytidine deaminase [Verrucomicrobiota bacterium]
MKTPDALLEVAATAAGNAYCPCSHCRVGAALLCADGKVFRGCNVENASCGLTVCAERAAFFTAVSAGRRKFTAMAIVAGSEWPVVGYRWSAVGGLPTENTVKAGRWSAVSLRSLNSALNPALSAFLLHIHAAPAGRSWPSSADRISASMSPGSMRRRNTRN